MNLRGMFEEATLDFIQLQQLVHNRFHSIMTMLGRRRRR